MVLYEQQCKLERVAKLVRAEGGFLVIMQNFFAQIKGKLIVSCQALADEPLHSPFIMGRMALAAKEGGAAAIRAQGVEDIREIAKVTGLPIIGLIKRNYADSDIYITATKKEVDELLTAPCDMIAVDMTNRPRPHGEQLPDLIDRIHAAGRMVLADISTYEEGVAAAQLGADAVSTTMSGYTHYSPQLKGPDMALAARLAADLAIPVFAEGRIQTPEELRQVMELGVWSAIVGSAITRPQLITQKFTDVLK